MKKLIWILACGYVLGAHATVLQSNSTFGFIELLHWQVREGGADNWAQVITPVGTQRSATVIDAPFDWNTGVRVGIGRSFDADDLTFSITHYQSTASNQASGRVYSAFLANYFANNTNGASFGPFYRSASIRWRFLFNTADVDLGHRFDLDSVLILHPHIGIKFASIDQTIFSNWNNPVVPTTFTTATENLKNDFFGVGPTVGIDSNWPFYVSAQQSLALIGNITGGLLYGHWHFKDIYANNKPVTITSYVDSVNGVSPVIDGFLGMQWEKQFTKSVVSARAGYEEQIWFSQVQYYSLDMGRLNRSASLQGYNLEFKYTC